MQLVPLNAKNKTLDATHAMLQNVQLEIKTKVQMCTVADRGQSEN